MIPSMLPHIFINNAVQTSVFLIRTPLPILSENFGVSKSKLKLVVLELGILQGTPRNKDNSYMKTKRVWKNLAISN